MKAVVIGAGITGLTCALELEAGARAAGLPLDVTVLEATKRFGGVIGTVARDGFLLEEGPDSLITTKPAALALATALGLEDRLVGTRAGSRRSFVARAGRLYPVPDGFYLLAPTAIGPFLRSRLFSLPGKLRMGLELLLPRRRAVGDESLASFVRRRLGREALERIVQPMVAGIYTADPEELSLDATMPQFAEMERRHGSVIRGMLAGGHARATGAATASGPRYGLFATLRGGLVELVAALSGRLGQGQLALSAPVRRLERTSTGWRVLLEDDSLDADAVCVALPPARALDLMRDLDPEAARALAGIPGASVATLNLAYRRSDVEHPLDGMGLVIPATEGATMTACSFSSQKYEGRAPDETVLLRAFVGGALGADVYARDDDAILAGVQDDLRRLLGIRTPPLFTHLARHAEAMPQYRLGHLDRVATIERRVSELPGLALAGNGYRGVGVPDCIASAQAAATKLVSDLVARRADISPAISAVKKAGPTRNSA